MSIIIIGESFSFPDGNAATNRVHTYAKGFYTNGINTHVICFGSMYDTSGDGITNGIFYYHPFGQRLRSKNLIIRQFHKLNKYYKTILLFNKINKFDKIIAINVWGSKLRTQFFIYILAKFLNSLMLLESSEHPLRNYQSSILQKILGEIKSYAGSTLFNGIFCISQYLIDFYKTRGLSEKRLLLVPSTVDCERFSSSYDSPFEFEYILYCGSLTILKDGVNILVESFARISDEFPQIKLVLIGKGDSIKEEIEIKELVNKLKINQNVLFLGQLSRKEIPKYMINAKILALARPKSIVADAGFPSKLTEYLAAGKPVVVTKVGDIPVYLSDNENAFLSEPDSVEAFTEKLNFVLNNYSFAKNVSLKGSEIAKTIFNCNFQAKRILHFILHLKES